MDDRAPGGARPVSRVPDGICLRCGHELGDLGNKDLRIGGVTGGWHFLAGGLADVSEGMVRLRVLACVECDHVEYRRPSRR